MNTLSELKLLVNESKRLTGRLYTPTQLRRAESSLISLYKKYGRPKSANEEAWCDNVTKFHTNSMYKSNRLNAWADILVNRGHTRAAKSAVERAKKLATESALRGPEWPDELFKTYEQILAEI